RQHTSDDILGVDTDGDQIVDSFFVQFNYLARNAIINGCAAAMAARNVPTPADFTAQRAGDQLYVSITDSAGLGLYRVALRQLISDWDTVYTMTGTALNTFPAPGSGPLYVSVAGVDAQGVESLFSAEKPATGFTGTIDPDTENKNITLFQNRPNPFDEATWISFWVNKSQKHQTASLRITDVYGRMIQDIKVEIREGLNEVLYTHGYGVRGAFTYTLLIDGQAIDSKQMVFAN
ncbi:MAG: M28 family peptidase, partial [Saprospiraceae bacterium]